MILDPEKLGADLRRPRYYIVMIHTHVLDGQSEQAIAEILREKCGSIEWFFEDQPSVCWEDLLFPDTHSLVRSWRQDHARTMFSFTTIRLEAKGFAMGHPTRTSSRCGRDPDQHA